MSIAFLVDIASLAGGCCSRAGDCWLAHSLSLLTPQEDWKCCMREMNQNAFLMGLFWGWPGGGGHKGLTLQVQNKRGGVNQCAVFNLKGLTHHIHSRTGGNEPGGGGYSI